MVVGGPPCQAYARVGRAKLREILSHPSGYLQDDRRNLYIRFLEYVRELQPLAVVFENVPDAINYGGHNILGEIAESLEDLGFRCKYTLLNSAHYGVPQLRERAFLIALAAELDRDVVFPEATNHAALPSGYHGTRAVALKNVTGELFGGSNHFVPPVAPVSTLPGAITAEIAIGDLPPITGHLHGLIKRGARRFDQPIKYSPTGPVSVYADEMRKRPRFEGAPELYDHVIRYLPRDYPIFRKMQPGDQYPQAHQIALVGLTSPFLRQGLRFLWMDVSGMRVLNTARPRKRTPRSG